MITLLYSQKYVLKYYLYRKILHLIFINFVKLLLKPICIEKTVAFYIHKVINLIKIL